jgi:hypothetical protein
LRCREPNEVVAEQFARLAKQARSSCVVHLFPERGFDPWRYWVDYLSPLRDVISGHNVRIYALDGASTNGRGGFGEREEQLQRVEDLYRRMTGPEGMVTSEMVGDASSLLPPYRQPYCNDGPVLEMMEGTRLVSDQASYLAEGLASRARAARTILVQID